jgi:limonene-1,2-epoxide hydrolase
VATGDTAVGSAKGAPLSGTAPSYGATSLDLVARHDRMSRVGPLPRIVRRVRRALALGAVLVVAAAGSGAACAADETRTPVQVVRAWSHDLNANRNEAAARLFVLGALIVQPGYELRLTTHALARAWNNALPCAGAITHLQVKGARVTATFVLGERPKHRCDGPGEKAAAVFVVRKGKIVLWRQIPVPQQAPSA